MVIITGLNQHHVDLIYTIAYHNPVMLNNVKTSLVAKARFIRGHTNIINPQLLKDKIQDCTIDVGDDNFDLVISNDDFDVIYAVLKAGYDQNNGKYPFNVYDLISKVPKYIFDSTTVFDDKIYLRCPIW